MPRHSIDVTVYPSDGDRELEQLDFTDVNYVSLVNSETFGIPALIAEQRVETGGLPVRILYINPENVAAFQATREK